MSSWPPPWPTGVIPATTAMPTYSTDLWPRDHRRHRLFHERVDDLVRLVLLELPACQLVLRVQESGVVLGVAMVALGVHRLKLIARVRGMQ